LFLNNRHYDPTTGVFVSVDPLVTMTGEPYVYGGANPITRSDPSGLCATGLVVDTVGCAIVGTALVATAYVACLAAGCDEAIAEWIESLDFSLPSLGGSGDVLDLSGAISGHVLAERLAQLQENADDERVRRFVDEVDDLLGVAEEAAGGDLDALDEFKPGWYQGTRPDGTTVKIELELEGHLNPPEGPHVTVRVPRDSDIGPSSGWEVIDKIFVQPQPWEIFW